jgi:inner membrane protein
MDSLTHIALGACVGGLLAGRSVGRKALVWGAVAQSLPDIDFLAGLWCDPAEDLLAHRGFTHSFLFTLLFSPLLAGIASRLHRVDTFSYKRWIIFFGLQITVHLLLDALNVYGTGWWEPFSHHRVSANLLFVADPLITLPLLLAAGFLFFQLRNKAKLNFRPVFFAFGFCVVYLLAALYSKQKIEKEILQTCQQKGIRPLRYFSTPAPFTSFLWYYVLDVGDGFYVGYRSVFEKDPTVALQYFPQQDSLLLTSHDREDVQQLIRFSKGFYVLQHYQGNIVFNDLRFGQQLGWSNPKAPFSFYYFLAHPGQNNFIIQRGRVAGWKQYRLREYIRRILGANN